MWIRLAERGAWVTVSGKATEPISGWLIGEIPQGLLLAIDENMNDVRLVRDYTSISYSPERGLSKLQYGNSKEIEDQLNSADGALQGPMRKAISRLRFHELHQFGHRAAEVRRQIHRTDRDRFHDGYDHTPRDELVEYLNAQADRSTGLHRQVYEALDDSGLTEIVGEYGPTLARLPAELVIPAHDLEFESSEELKSTLERTRDDRWTSSGHLRSLEIAEETRTRLLVEATREREKRGEDKSEKRDDSTLFSRWVGPSLRVLAGTGLTAANAALGVTAGLTATIVTIGATAVPAYVGLVTSIYTGLAQVSDGLEKMGRRK
jgi:hypothetical protein